MRLKTSYPIIEFFGVILMALVISFAIGTIFDKTVWPAESDLDKSLEAAEKLIDETISQFTEVEKWPVIETKSIDGLFFVMSHEDPKLDHYAITISFSKETSDGNWKPEVFVRIFDVERTKRGSLTGTRVSMKLGDGSWTPPLPGQLFKINSVLINGEPGFAFRILDENGNTKFLRTFIKKDFVKSK